MTQPNNAVLLCDGYKMTDSPQVTPSDMLVMERLRRRLLECEGLPPDQAENIMSEFDCEMRVPKYLLFWNVDPDTGKIKDCKLYRNNQCIY